MHIRKYKQSDKKDIEYIHFETGFLGKSMSSLLSNNHLWKKKIRYYLEKKPESIFVLEDKNKIVGYLLGSLKHDDKKISYIINNIFNLIKSFFLPKKDRIFWKSQFINLIRILFKRSDEYKLNIPKKAAHFHINLLPEVRNKGYGTKLLKEFEKYAKKNNVKIIHAESFKTKINPNTNFWLKNDFRIYSKVKTSFWKKQLPNQEISLICYFKKLP